MRKWSSQTTSLSSTYDWLCHLNWVFVSLGFLHLSLTGLCVTMNVAIYNFVSKTIDEVVWNILLYEEWINVCITHSTFSSLIFLSNRGFRCLSSRNTIEAFDKYCIKKDGKKVEREKKEEREGKSNKSKVSIRERYFLSRHCTRWSMCSKPQASWSLGSDHHTAITLFSW